MTRGPSVHGEQHPGRRPPVSALSIERRYRPDSGAQVRALLRLLEPGALDREEGAAPTTKAAPGVQPAPRQTRARRNRSGVGAGRAT